MHIISYSPVGYRGQLVSVEVDLRTGIPGTDIIGLPASEIREARERVRVALRNSGFSYPSCRVLVNLAPADVPKSGNSFDLAIALAVILKSGQLEQPAIPRVMVVGELHLDGSVGKVRGAISAVDEASRAGIAHFVVPSGNRGEASAVGQGNVAVVRHLAQLGRLIGELEKRHPEPNTGATRGLPGATRAARLGDYLNMRGSAVYKRALTIAAAGGHHLIVVGPPGAGKSMGVSLLPTILPPMDRSESLEVTRIHSIAGEEVPPDGLVRDRPFRSPHHNSSVEGLLGGGRSMRPGEVSLAHRGVLFLDEALEFTRPALQGLREPLERRRVRISRAGRNYWYPAQIQLFLAANPCPCGNLGRPERICLCSINEVERYWRRIGGPLLDRIDLRVTVQSSDVDSLPMSDSSGEMGEMVRAAWERQRERRSESRSRCNARIPVERLFGVCRMKASVRSTYTRGCSSLRLSARASVSVGRVARTIADISGSEIVEEEHVLEAFAHRRKGEDQALWETA